MFKLIQVTNVVIFILINLIVIHGETEGEKNDFLKYNYKRSTRNRVTRFPGDKSKEMCEKYAEYVYIEEESPALLLGANKERVAHCGLIESPLITNGEDAKSKEFPHMALIGYGNHPEIRWLCGGSLISERYILTAAHCTYASYIRKYAKWALLGDLIVLSEEDNEETQPVTYEIIERINHPLYTTSSPYNDIALFKLEEDVALNPFIRPLCLYTKFEINKVNGLISGWGHTTWRGRPTDALQKAVVKFQTNQHCDSIYKRANSTFLSKGVIETNQICAGSDGKDTCQGDSGGPIQIRLEEPFCMYSIVGVTSYGRKCGDKYPGIYTRVSRYIKWIEDIVWP